MTGRDDTSVESVALYRGGRVVSSLASAQGRGLRETRLTASLGYLIALCPCEFLKIFGFPGKARAVTVEHGEYDGRSDIRIETDRGVGIVEAKVTAGDPSLQAKRYQAKWHVCLTRYRHSQIRGSRGSIRYLHWMDLYPVLEAAARTSKHDQRFVAEDIIRYLQEHHMIPRKDPVEIYARELNDDMTVRMFLHGQIYGCNYEKNSRLPEAMYFAPHFGKKIAGIIPGIHPGISYIARINQIEIIQSWDEFKRATQAAMGKAWWNRHRDLIFDPLRQHWRWTKKTNQRSILYLDPPRLVFNPPVRKDNLQKGKGWLSKRFLSFDMLFGAWKG